MIAPTRRNGWRPTAPSSLEPRAPSPREDFFAATGAGLTGSPASGSSARGGSSSQNSCSGVRGGGGSAGRLSVRRPGGWLRRSLPAVATASHPPGLRPQPPSSQPASPPACVASPRARAGAARARARPGRRGSRRGRRPASRRSSTPPALRSRPGRPGRPASRCAAAIESRERGRPAAPGGVRHAGGQALVVGLDRDREHRFQFGAEAAGQRRLAALLAAEVERQADDDPLDLVLGDQLGDRARPPAVRSPAAASPGCRWGRRARSRSARCRGRGRARARVSRAPARSHARAAASASSSLAGSRPPAWAMSSRPPPPPPTTAAASRTSLAAERPRPTAASETSETSATLSPSPPPSSERRGAAERRLDPVGEVEQLLLAGQLRRGDHDLDAADIRRRGDQALGLLAERPAAVPAPLRRPPRAAARPRGGHRRAGPAGCRAARPASRSCRSRSRNQSIAAGPVIASIRRTLAALEPSEDDLEDADLGRVGDVGAAAELARDAVDLDHPHPLAVFLAEQGHRAELLGLGPLHARASAPARLALIHSLTRSSTSRSSSGLSAWPWVKSKRSLSGRTAEPAWRTWVPSRSRSAACRRCVAVWLRIVAWRVSRSTTASTATPGSTAAPLGSTSSTWSSPTR